MPDTDDARWLSAEEMAAWLPLINVAMRLPAKLDTQLRADAGITHYEFMVLTQLSQAPERTLGLSALAEAANSSPSRLSHVLRKLGSAAGSYATRTAGRRRRSSPTPGSQRSTVPPAATSRRCGGRCSTICPRAMSPHWRRHW